MVCHAKINKTSRSPTTTTKKKMRLNGHILFLLAWTAILKYIICKRYLLIWLSHSLKGEQWWVLSCYPWYIRTLWVFIITIYPFFPVKLSTLKEKLNWASSKSFFQVQIRVQWFGILCCCSMESATTDGTITTMVITLLGQPWWMKRCTNCCCEKLILKIVRSKTCSPGLENW